MFDQMCTFSTKCVPFRARIDLFDQVRTFLDQKLTCSTKCEPFWASVYFFDQVGTFSSQCAPFRTSAHFLDQECTRVQSLTAVRVMSNSPAFSTDNHISHINAHQSSAIIM